MKPNWTRRDFAEVIDFLEGPGIMAVDFREEGVPLIRLSGVSQSGSVLVGCNYLDPEKVRRRWAHFRVRRGDTLLSTSASLGRVKVVDAAGQGAIPYTGIIRMRPRGGELRPEFIPYLLEGHEFQTQAEAVGVGSVMRHFGPSHLRRMTLTFPPIATQRKIVSILAAYDDLIENNARRIQILEEMAQAIYREWFVEFRYPGHGEVPLVDSEIGPVPEGWILSQLGTVGTWLSGGTPSTSEPTYWNGDIPWITSGSLTGYYLSASDRMLTGVGVKSGSRMVPRDTILFVVRGMSLAKEFRVGIAQRPLAFGQDCKAVQLTRAVSPLLVLHSLIYRAPQIAKMVEFAAHGTGKLSTDRLKALPLLVPSPDLQRRFDQIAEAIRSQVATLQAMSSNLRQTRDLLLPRLISGEIDVEHLDIDTSGLAA